MLWSLRSFWCCVGKGGCEWEWGRDRGIVLAFGWGGLGRFCRKKEIVSFCVCLLFVCIYIVVSNEITGRDELNVLNNELRLTPYSWQRNFYLFSLGLNSPRLNNLKRTSFLEEEKEERRRGWGRIWMLIWLGYYQKQAVLKRLSYIIQIWVTDVKTRRTSLCFFMFLRVTSPSKKRFWLLPIQLDSIAISYTPFTG